MMLPEEVDSCPSGYVSALHDQASFFHFTIPWWNSASDSGGLLG
jgi:hypothetical protein